MKRKLVLGCFVVCLVGIGSALYSGRSSKRAPKVSVSFAGYTNEYAVFRIYNPSTNQLVCAAGKIELQKGNVWVADTNRLRHVPAPILESGASISVFVPVPHLTNAWRCRIFITDLADTQIHPWLGLLSAIGKSFLARWRWGKMCEAASPPMRRSEDRDQTVISDK